MVFQLLQLFESDGKGVVHKALPQVTKDLVLDDSGSLLEEVLWKVAVVGDADLENVLVHEILLLFLDLGNAGVIVRNGAIVVTIVGEHIEVKTFLSELEGARHEGGLGIAHGADVLQSRIRK